MWVTFGRFSDFWQHAREDFEAKVLLVAKSGEEKAEKGSGAVFRRVLGTSQRLQVGYVNEFVLRDQFATNGTLSQRLYVLQDANDDVTALVNTSGVVQERFVYDPYGAVSVLSASWSPTTDSVGWRYEFQGGRSELVTGWVGFDNRDYIPSEARWAQQDPLGLAADNNSYRFVGNNPASLVDPLGLSDGSGPENDLLNRYQQNGGTLGSGINPIGVGTYQGQQLVNDVNQTATAIADAVPSVLNAAQTTLDVAGVADPTPVSDSLGALVAALRGDPYGVATSVLGAIFPFFGDLAKGAKAGKNLANAGEAASPLLKNADEAAGIVCKNGAPNDGLRRSYTRKGTRADVEGRAPRTADGRPIDPNTGEPINGTPDLGHKPGHEFRREQAKAQAEGLTQKQFNDRMNNPDLYQLENPSSNRSHRFEKPGND